MRRFLLFVLIFALVGILFWLTARRLGLLPAIGRLLPIGGNGPGAAAPLVVVARERCPGAPFILPADGEIGLFYNDPNGPYSTAAPHQGIDIFSNADPGVTPVYAAYDGTITREPDWRSTLIQRVPEDPLEPGRQIWYC